MTLKRVSSQKIIGQITPGIIADSIVLSPDLKHFAFVIQKGLSAGRAGAKQAVVLDGKEQPAYDGVWNLTFSPDSRRFGYSAFYEDKRFMVVDGAAQKDHQYYNNSEIGPIFSPDSQRVLYIASATKAGLMKTYWARSVVADGKEDKPYDAILSVPQFSPDSRKVVYAAGLGDKQFTVLNGQEGKHYDGVSAFPVFSPDSARIMYGARIGAKNKIVLDTKEINECNGVVPSALVFSPDNKRRAYAIIVAEGKRAVVIEGKEQKNYDDIREGSLVFSPAVAGRSDSKRFAYSAKVGDKWFLNLDAKEIKKYDDIPVGAFSFSPDSRRYALVAVLKVWEHLKATTYWVVMTDGKDGKQYDSIISFPIFSPNSRHLAYAAELAGKALTVVDDVGSKPYDYIEPNSLVYGPADGNHLAFTASIGDQAFVVLDGVDGEKFDEIITQGVKSIVFDSGDKFHYLALKNDKIILVEEQIE